MEPSIIIFITSIIISILFMIAKHQGISKGFILIVLILIITLAPTVHDWILKSKGEFVDAQLILTTPSWGLDKIHSERKEFVSIEEYVGEIADDNTTHIKKAFDYVILWLSKDENYQSFESYDSNGYMVVKIVDEESQYYNKVIIGKFYDEEKITSDIIEVHVIEDGNNFAFNKLIAEDMALPVIAACILLFGMFAGIIGKHNYGREFFDEWGW